MKITQREKGDTWWGERKMRSRGRVSPFSRGVIFTRAPVSFGLVSLRKNGGLLVVYSKVELIQLGSTHEKYGV